MPFCGWILVRVCPTSALFLHIFWNRTSGTTGTCILWAKCPSCHFTNTTIKESSDSNHHHHFVIYHQTSTERGIALIMSDLQQWYHIEISIMCRQVTVIQWCKPDHFCKSKASAPKTKTTTAKTKTVKKWFQSTSKLRPRNEDNDNVLIWQIFTSATLC